MKQGMRFFLKPGSFVNQLQWSSHHTLILAAFFASALVETQLGGRQLLYGQLASLMAGQWGVSLNVAVWLVTFLKLVCLQLGAWILTETIHFLGGIFGKPASRRVLFRRLAVVFSLLLLAQSCYGLALQYPLAPLAWAAWMACAALWLWGTLLGFYTIRGQFGLTAGEASAIGVFALLLAIGTWSLAVSEIEETIARSQQTPRPALAKRPSPHHHYR